MGPAPKASPSPARHTADAADIANFAARHVDGRMARPARSSFARESRAWDSLSGIIRSRALPARCRAVL